MSIKYILLDVDNDAASTMRALRAQTTRMDVLVVDEEQLKGEDLLLSRFDTEHPTLVIGDDGCCKAAWIEGLHERNSGRAFDVTYVSPKAMDRRENRVRCNAYKEKVERILAGCIPLAA